MLSRTFMSSNIKEPISFKGEVSFNINVNIEKEDEIPINQILDVVNEDIKKGFIVVPHGFGICNPMIKKPLDFVDDLGEEPYDYCNMSEGDNDWSSIYFDDYEHLIEVEDYHIRQWIYPQIFQTYDIKNHCLSNTSKYKKLGFDRIDSFTKDCDDEYWYEKKFKEWMGVQMVLIPKVKLDGSELEVTPKMVKDWIEPWDSENEKG